MTRLSLRTLEAKLIRITGPGRRQEVASLAEAQGVRFLCPKCFATNGGARGTHSVVCWSRSRGVPEDESPGPGRWKLDGSGLDDLTLNGDAPGGGGARSVLLNGGCGWHGFVNAGVGSGSV